MLILILTNATDGHLPWLTRRLDARGERYLRFDPASLPNAGAVTVTYGRDGIESRQLRHSEGLLDLVEVKSVWLRRPGTPGETGSYAASHREWALDTWSQFMHGVWTTLECLWLPGTYAAQQLAGLKVSQLALAARLGFRVPRTLTTNDPSVLLEFYEACEGRVVAKGAVPRDIPDRDGEQRLPFTRPVHRRELHACRSLRHAPVTFQEYVAKRAELRVTVVGDRLFAAEIDSQASHRTRHDWRHYDDDRARYSVHSLPAGVAALCVAVTRAFGLCFGAIDLILTPAGEYVFLEINPNGQWAWVEELTKLPIADAIADLLAQGKQSKIASRVPPLNREEPRVAVPV